MIGTPKHLPERRFFKLTNLTERHNSLQYITGLNTDRLPFNPTGECSPGGLYFFDETQLKYFFRYTGGDIVHIREVTFPLDTRIYCEKGKYKCDKFVLGERKKFYFDEYVSKDSVLAAIQQDGRVLRYVKVQTPELCLAAVQQYGWALEYVKVQTPEICLAAVQQRGWALEYVKVQTEEICLAAVKKNGRALKYVKEQTTEICLAAVQQNGYALQFVKDQTPEICLEAVKQDGGALQWVEEKTQSSVKKDGRKIIFKFGVSTITASVKTCVSQSLPS